MIQRFNSKKDYICNFKAKVIYMQRPYIIVRKPLIDAGVLNHGEEYLIEVSSEEGVYQFKDRFIITKGGNKFLIPVTGKGLIRGKIYWFKVKR